MLVYIYIALFVSLPEIIITLLIGFSLSNIRNVSPIKLLAISIIQTNVSLFLMVINFRSGYSTIIQIFSLYLLVIFFVKLKYHKAMIPVLIGSFSQGALQSIIVPIMSRSLSIEIVLLKQNFNAAIIFFLPIFIISVVLLGIIKKRDFHIWDIDI